jgi:hypothetical protein
MTSGTLQSLTITGNLTRVKFPGTTEPTRNKPMEEYNWGTYWAGLSWAEQDFIYALWGVLYNTHLRPQLRPI